MLFALYCLLFRVYMSYKETGCNVGPVKGSSVASLFQCSAFDSLLCIHYM